MANNVLDQLKKYKERSEDTKYSTKAVVIL